MKQKLPFHARIFLESHCNFRCVYCNPEAVRQEDKVITNEEIKNFIYGVASNGVRQIHYSGGEPTLRKGLAEIMSFAKKMGIKEQAMTTNGVLLPRYLEKYIAAGLSRVNISIDSLDREKFFAITKKDELNSVLSAIDLAASKFELTKINVVVMKNNINEVTDILEFCDEFEGRVVPRFIELQKNQPVFYTPDHISKQHVNEERILSKFAAFGRFRNVEVEGKNPNCRYFSFEGRSTSAGLIANHSRGYPCGGCRKLRLSPYGDLGVCISAEGVNVRHKNSQELGDIVASQIQKRFELDVLRPNRLHLSHDYGFWRWGDLNPENSNRPIAVHTKK